MLLEPLNTSTQEVAGYLPLLQTSDYTNPQWSGQESVAFPDNWNVGLSFFHNVFAREHNLFVDAFRKQATATPEDDSGLRNPAKPNAVIRYKDVTSDELFEVARLVIAAEIAKIHTIEWTTQLLYNEPVYLAMNANWSGLVSKHPLVETALEAGIGSSSHIVKWKNNGMVFRFCRGPGIFGLRNDKPDINGWRQPFWLAV